MVKEITITVPNHIYLALRMTCIHNKTSVELAAANILKNFYDSRKKD